MKNSTVLMNSMYVLRFIALTWVIMACSVLTHAQKECCIEMPHYVLKASASRIDSLYVQNLASEKIIQLGELRLRWRPFVEPLSTCDYELTWIGGQPAIRCVYRLPHSVPSSIHLTGLFVAFPDRIDVSYQLSGIPSGYIESWEGTQFRFRWLQTERGIAGKEVKLGLWKRNVEGGLPLEEFDCKIYPFYMDDKTICLAYDADNRANSNWIENEYRHTVLAKDGEHSYCTQYSILFASEEYPFEAISARWKGRPFALKLKSERVYNWWESTSDTIRLQAQVVNTSGEKKECVLNYWIRNYAGDLVNRNSIALSLAQMSKEEVTLEIVPETERELYFVEASVCDKQGEEIVFCRTNVGLLPPHQFKSSAAKSIMGLAAALMDDVGGADDNYKFPKKYHNRDALMKLPGIGQKTANVIMNVLWGAPNIGVDTHVFRNSHRYGWVGADANTPEKVEEQLLKIIPKKYHPIVNHVMVLHGRYICRAIRPKCGECPVARWCNAPDKII